MVQRGLWPSRTSPMVREAVEVTDEVRHRVLWEEGVKLFEGGAWTYRILVLGLAMTYTRDESRRKQYEEYRKKGAWNSIHNVDR